MEKIKNFENLLKKFNQGALSNSEIVCLMNYFKDIKPGSEQEAMLQKILDESSDFNNNIDSDWIFNQVLNKVNSCGVSDQGQEAEPAVRRVKSVNLKKIWIPALRYAAVFILAFTLFWLIRPSPDLVEKDRFAGHYQKIIVPYGSKTKVELPDGSVVILNSGSNLSYTYSEFNTKQRLVMLDGEGFFEVKRDTAIPFCVLTPGIKIKVLGTSFNIKAYPDEDIEEMTLVTGSVEVYTRSDMKNNKHPVLLRPNEKAIYSRSAGELTTQTVFPVEMPPEPDMIKALKQQAAEETEKVILWKDDKLLFDNEQFSSLIIKIERWYDVRIKVEYPELNRARFTGKFDKESVEQVMYALSTITPFKFEINKNNITITRY